MATAKVFWSGRSQAVRLPKEFRVDGDEVRIRRQGSKIILEPIPEDWAWLDALHKEFGRPGRRLHSGDRGGVADAGTAGAGRFVLELSARYQCGHPEYLNQDARFLRRLRRHHAHDIGITPPL